MGSSSGVPPSRERGSGIIGVEELRVEDEASLNDQRGVGRVFRESTQELSEQQELVNHRRYSSSRHETLWMRFKLFVQNSVFKSLAFNRFASMFLPGAIGKNSTRIAALRSNDAKTSARIGEMKSTMHKPAGESVIDQEKVKISKFDIIFENIEDEKEQPVGPQLIFKDEGVPIFEFRREETTAIVRRLQKSDDESKIGVQNCANKFENQELGVALLGGTGAQEESLVRETSAGYALCPWHFGISHEDNEQLFVNFEDAPQGLALPVIGGKSTEGVRLLKEGSDTEFEDKTFMLYSSAALDKNSNYDKEVVKEFAKQLADDASQDFDKCTAKVKREYLARAFQKITKEQIRADLKAFKDSGCKTVVLAMKGCGAFGNNPREVGEIYGELLAGEFAGDFEHVVFGAPDDRTRPAFEWGFCEGVKKAGKQAGVMDGEYTVKEYLDPTGELGFFSKNRDFMSELIKNRSLPNNQKIVCDENGVFSTEQIGRKKITRDEVKNWRAFGAALKEAKKMGLIDTAFMRDLYESFEKNRWCLAMREADLEQGLAEVGVTFNR